MATTPDRRVRRTRKALQDALVALMAEKSYEAITVQHIIDRADVGRSTFYGHYLGKDDLLQDGITDLREVVEASGAEPLGFSLPLLRHVNEHQRLARALLSHPGGAGALGRMEDLILGVARTELADVLTTKQSARVPSEAVVRYVAGAYLSLLGWWLRNDTGLSPEDLDRIFQTLVAPGIAALRGFSSAG